MEKDRKCILYLFVVFLFSFFFCVKTELLSQEKNKKQIDSLVILSYNVENLFDTIKDSLYNDIEFTPKGKKQWTRKKYFTKLNRIAEVISRSGYYTYPSIVGLIEVENENVIRDLGRRPALKNANYQFFVSRGKDSRGIGLAFLYQNSIFQPYSIFEKTPNLKGKQTRPILCMSGTSQGDTLHFVLCHFPSKRGGVKQTNPLRIEASKTLFSIIDSLQRLSSKAKIVVMGDFNTLFSELKFLWKEHFYNSKLPILCEVFNVKKSQNLLIEGSYFYRNVWQQIDFFLITASLLQEQSSWFYLRESAQNIWYQELLSRNKFGEYYPKRSFKGDFYTAAYSDHLPIRMVLIKKK